MPIEILMPALSPTMTEGTLAKWTVKEGDAIESGQVIAEIETDKATMEVEAVDEGTMGKILIEAGTMGVPVNKLVALLLEDGEDKSALDSYTAENDAPAQADAPVADSADDISEEEDAGQAAQAAVIPEGITELLMPALSPTMTEGTLANWTIKVGDTIESGQVIAEIETDKATMEVEAVDDGILAKILVESGSANVPVNKAIALIASEGTDVSVAEGYKPAVEAVAPKQKATKSTSTTSAPQSTAALAPNAPTSAPKPPSASSAPLNSTNRVSATPLARRMAEDAGISLSSIRGTGPKGRIIKADVEDCIATGGASGGIRRDTSEFIQNPNNTMRRTIAKRLLESKQQVPHFYLSVDCELDKLLDVRAQLNAKGAKEAIDGKPAYKCSVNDFVIKATALALQDVPAANASWYDDAIVQYTNVDVSVAVTTDGGLITPIIKNADQKSLPAISGEMKDLATRARNNALMPEEYQGGGFSISNLGMFGVKTFSAIINPPQSCILAVGAGEQRAVVKNGELTIANVVTVTLSVDHRSVDGAVGAQFLQAFKEYVESPALMLL